MSTTPDSYHRTDDFETRIDSVLLPNEAWAVFAHLEKPITVAEIARRTEMDVATVQQAIDGLVENKLARKHLMNWRDFLAQKGISAGPTRMSPAGPQPPPAALATQARRETPAPAPEISPLKSQTSDAAPAPAAAADTSSLKPQVSTTPPAPAPSRATAITRRPPPREPEPVDPEGTISFTLVNESARRTRRAHLAMSITFRLGAAAPARVAPAPSGISNLRSQISDQTPAARPAAATRPAPVPTPAPEPEPELVGAVAEVAPSRTLTQPRKLRPLIDAITRKGGGGLNGQLLVYRVFLRVPPAVMFNAGIKSLSLVDDSLELNDEAVYDVIRAAAKSVASIDLDAVAAG